MILLLVWYLSIPDEWRVKFVALGRTRHPGSTFWTLIAIPHYLNVPFNIDVDVHGHFRTIPEDILLNQQATIGFPLNVQGVYVFGGLPFVYNVVADFVALMVTQRVLEDMTASTMLELIIRFFVASVCILVVSFIALDLAVLLLSYLFYGAFPSGPAGWIFSPRRFMGAILFPFYKTYPQEWQIDTLYGVFVWSTLTGIIWLFIFSASVLVANVSIKLKGLGPWLNRKLQVQRQPIRILRALVIILLSGLCAIYHLLVLL